MSGLVSSLQGDVEKVAPKLLGSILRRQLDGQELSGKIVEVEAYWQEDAASHSYHGQTERNAVMFGPAGRLYVYFTYGKHYCCNVVVGEEGVGAAVLIRAIEPIAGQEKMQQLRHSRSGTELTNGPAKVCQALQIDRRFNNHDLTQTPLTLELPAIRVPVGEIVTSPRIGITRATDKLWRYYLRGNPYVSGKR